RIHISTVSAIPPTHTLSLHDALPISEATPQEKRTSANDLQEQEIIRLLLHYGAMPASWLKEDNYPVALLILSSLQDVEFTNPVRSEEHTSELQSRENLVCRLLLEKKK